MHVKGIEMYYYLLSVHHSYLLTLNEFIACVTFSSELKVNSLINCKFEEASFSFNSVAIYIVVNML